MIQRVIDTDRKMYVSAADLAETILQDKSRLRGIALQRGVKSADVDDVIHDAYLSLHERAVEGAPFQYITLEVKLETM